MSFTHSITLPSALFDVTIGKRDGIKHSFVVDLGKLPMASINAILTYGIQRIVNDKCGGADKTADEKAEIARKTIERLNDGSIAMRMPRSEGEPEINRFIRAEVRRCLSTESKREYKALAADDRDDYLDAKFAAVTDEAFKTAIMANAEKALADDMDKRNRTAQLVSKHKL